ncbi:uncharacterized protein At4g38062-like [Tasmannia lanceolata]|uniref:uncharacterized protein At4g38062-like n=1 Tax=Tasmannia lanceolata TaxID=3420 RepID=UPI00406476AA
MDEICKELDEVKAAMEKLTATYHAKAQLSESLTKAHNEQLTKVKEAKMEIEKLTQELNAKREEISLASQMYEDLKSNLQQKESILRHLSSTNDQLQNSCEEKVQRLEREKIELVSALDEANAKIEDQEKNICAYREEIEDLKGLLPVSQKKCSDAEERAKATKELSQRDDLLLQLKEVIDKALEKLIKWRNEKFKHPEEAQEKPQDQFRAGMNGWHLEKSKLLDDISSFQANLEAQTTVSEGLRSQLHICNQALAHEESRRILLGLQLSGAKICDDNVAAEHEEAISMIESLTVQRDEKIAALRDSLAMKETLFKEMEFVRAFLQREKQEANLRNVVVESLKKDKQILKESENLVNLRNVHQEDFNEYSDVEELHSSLPLDKESLEDLVVIGSPVVKVAFTNDVMGSSVPSSSSAIGCSGTPTGKNMAAAAGNISGHSLVGRGSTGVQWRPHIASSFQNLNEIKDGSKIASAQREKITTVYQLRESILQQYFEFFNCAGKEDLRKLNGIRDDRLGSILYHRELTESPFQCFDDIGKLGLSKKQSNRLMRDASTGLFKDQRFS